MTKEIWKDLKGYEGRYQVSNNGNVYGIYRGRILKPKIDKDGYKEYCLINDYGKRKCERGHRLVALMFCDKPKGHNVVNHKNMVKGDNRAENLEWSTISKNTKHAYDNCKHIRDMQLKASKAGADKIRMTIDVYKNNEYIGRFEGKETCAIELGISPKSIYNNINGITNSRLGYKFVEVGDANANNKA